MVWDIGPFSCMWTFNTLFPSVEETILSPLNNLDTLVDISVDHRCLDLFLDSQIDSIGLNVYTNGSTTLFWLL